MPTLRIALAQLNVTVGDLSGNAQRILGAYESASRSRPDILLFPELSLTGYPPEDLLHKSEFVRASVRGLKTLAKSIGEVPAVVGFVNTDKNGSLYDAAAVLQHGRILATYHKQCLPNYAVFDEQRYFASGKKPLILQLGPVRAGVIVCEDLWEEKPLRQLSSKNVPAVLCISASPYHRGKLKEREQFFAEQAKKHRMALGYCNLVGGQDELVFDGGSLAMDAAGGLLVHAKQFEEDLIFCDLPVEQGKQAYVRTTAVEVSTDPKPAIKPLRATFLSEEAEVYQALKLGLRDYAYKNGFKTVVLGLSGGIDSSLTACIAADALGPEHVVGVVMPTRYSTKGTQSDALKLAESLGIRVHEQSIESVFEACMQLLDPVLAAFKSKESPAERELMEQNLQPRIRCMLLMALSNHFGWLVLATSNKSETATGYTTLYGDMAGGFAVIKDVPKQLVFVLSRWRNGQGSRPVIPESILERPPSAELARDQKDEDSLPPYAVLDKILEAYVERDLEGDSLRAYAGVDQELSARVVRLVDRAEYKRRQGPPGIRITPKAFGKDRRMPITQRWNATD